MDTDENANALNAKWIAVGVAVFLAIVGAYIFGRSTAVTGSTAEQIAENTGDKRTTTKWVYVIDGDPNADRAGVEYSTLEECQLDGHKAMVLGEKRVEQWYQQNAATVLATVPDPRRELIELRLRQQNIVDQMRLDAHCKNTVTGEYSPIISAN